MHRANAVGTVHCVWCPRSAQRFGDDGLGLVDDALEMRLVPEALGVDFVDVFGARWTGGKPAVLRDDLQAADLRPVSRRPHQLRNDLLSSQRLGAHRFWS